MNIWKEGWHLVQAHQYKVYLQVYHREQSSASSRMHDHWISCHMIQGGKQMFFTEIT
jgi:hypothetical protein